MSGEKDRRSLFGSRISSIFNHEKTVPQGARGLNSPPPSQAPSKTSPSKSINSHAPNSLGSPSGKTLLRPVLNNKASDASLVSTTSKQSQTKPLVRNIRETQSPSPRSSRGSSVEPNLSGLELTPGSVRHNLRRKPPPPTVDSSGSSTNEFFNASSAPHESNNMDDIIGTLESEIDNYIKLEGAETNSDLGFSFQNNDYSSSSITPNLGISRSPPLMELSDFNNEFYDSESSLNLSKSKGSERNSTSNSNSNSDGVPYPVNDPFDSPMSGTYNADISYDNFLSEIPKDARQIDPLQSPIESSSSSTNITGIGGPMESSGDTLSRKNSDTFESSPQYDRRSSATSSQILHLATTHSNNSNLGSKPSASSSILKSSGTLTHTPTRTPKKTSTFDSGSSSNDFVTRSKTSATMPSFTAASSISNLNKTGHRQSGSISSLRSSNSFRNVNLSSLKKSLNLRPGEGERSNYVLNIRRTAGTAYNESGPGKWKLPTGISPIDISASYNKTNGKYRATIQNRSKKTSGVELKHGHLAPRLLASEVDDRDLSSVRLGPKVVMSSSSISKSPFNDTKSSNSSIAAPSTSMNNISRNNSLARTSTGVSVLTSDSQSVITESTKESRRRGSTTSSSSGSLSDEVALGAYYQHPAYKNGDDDLAATADEDEDNTDIETQPRNHFDLLHDADQDYDERPRLFLANPDYSDSD